MAGNNAIGELNGLGGLLGGGSAQNALLGNVALKGNRTNSSATV